MSRPSIHWALILCAIGLPALGQPPESGHYLFAWAGDVAQQGNDFLAVIDADPRSASYGHLLTTAVTDQRTGQVHHTEYTMPAGGLLFANDHVAGRTFIFDVRDPLHPKIAASFTDLGGYSHPAFLPAAAERPCARQFPAHAPSRHGYVDADDAAWELPADWWKSTIRAI